jgi:hypothetical protein
MNEIILIWGVLLVLFDVALVFFLTSSIFVIEHY